MVNRHPKGAKIGMESVGGRFAPKIYAHSNLKLADPFAADIQKAYDELLDPATRDLVPIETDAQKIALELIESREQLRPPAYHKEILEGKNATRSHVLDPELEAQWGVLYRKLQHVAKLGKLDKEGIDVAGEVVIEMLEHAKSYRSLTKGPKKSLPTLALAKAIVERTESKYALLMRFNIPLEEFKFVDGKNFSYLKALANAQNSGIERSALAKFAKEYCQAQPPSKRPNSRIVKESLWGLSEADEADLENLAGSEGDSPARDYISEVGLDLKQLTPKQRSLLAWEVLAESTDMSGKVAPVGEGVIDVRKTAVLKAELPNHQAVLQGWKDVAEGKNSIRAAAILSFCPSCSPQQAQSTLYMLSQTGGGRYATDLTHALIDRAALPKGSLEKALLSAQKKGGYISLEELEMTSKKTIEAASNQRLQGALSAGDVFSWDKAI